MRIASLGLRSGIPETRATLAPTLTVWLLLASVASAQANPIVDGEWFGPYDYSSQIQGPPPGTCGAPDEFSHAALIPTGLHRGKVLLWRFRVIVPSPPGPCVGTNTLDTWMWDPVLSQGPNPKVIKIDQELPSDLFCSGASWDADGQLVVAGGVGYDCPPNCFGQSEETYRFQPEILGHIVYTIPEGEPIVLATPWVHLGTAGELETERFYPTLLQLDRRPIEYGDQASQACVGPIPGSSTLVIGGPPQGAPGNPTSVDGHEAWELLGPGAASWSCPIVPPVSPLPHESLIGADRDIYALPTPPTPQPDIQLDSYPRAFQLTSGEIFVAGDVNTIELPGSTPAVVNTPGASWFMNPRYNPTLQPKWQLRRGPFAGLEGADPSGDRHYGCAVLMHMVDTDSRDRVLFFGGSYNANHYGANPDGNVPTTWVVHNSVQEYDPVASQWQTKAPMLNPRLFHNAVVLPTGEIFLVGGTSTDHGHTPVVTPLFGPELYDPGTQPTDPGSSRDLLLSNPSPLVDPPERTPRLYHSVALLLPDGRVFVGGGEETQAPYPNAEHTVEVYAPWYLYADFRPSLGRGLPTDIPFDTQAQPSQFTVGVTVTTGNAVDRMVLLRPGAVTHHFDNDQRYVELAFSATFTSSNPQNNTSLYAVTVTAPRDNLGPAGWYMLFALEKEPVSAVRVPSVGKFVRLF